MEQKIKIYKSTEQNLKLFSPIEAQDDVIIFEGTNLDVQSFLKNNLKF